MSVATYSRLIEIERELHGVRAKLTTVCARRRRPFSSTSRAPCPAWAISSHRLPRPVSRPRSSWMTWRPERSGRWTVNSGRKGTSMTAKRVASAVKTRPTIAAALSSLEYVVRAEALAKRINRRHPSDKFQQDVESVLWIAIGRGLDEMEARYGKDAAP